ncbi:MAG: exo-alpha-sialidase [Clostridia bacterium]|nr:exo-alpha-sialidase [Clostridia bacterium]
MKAHTSWSFRPYVQLHRMERGLAPYICRLAPGEDSFTVDFIDNGSPDAAHVVYYRVKDEGDFAVIRPENGSATISGLADQTDYEVYVERDDGARSSVRLVRTGYVPGTVVNYLHPADPEYAFSGNYLCSPSILRLPSGKLLASVDVYGNSTPQNLTLIYESRDNGKTWKYLTELFPCFWGKMFLADGKLYMMGCSNEYGDLLIGRSDDEGATWCMPSVLWRGAAHTRECGLHRAPMPVEISHGRVMTDVQYGSWSKNIMTDAVLSAPEGSDLLDAGNWVITPFWSGLDHPEVGAGSVAGIEGCVVTAPDGKVWDFLRYSHKKSLMLEFDPENPEADLKNAKLVDIPITTSKVDILYDKKSGLYWTIGSYALDEPKTNRNLLSLLVSDNLTNWTLVKHLIDYRELDPAKVGFQYVDFLFDGEDILYLCRTAFNQAHNFHDSNYTTFHRIENFRGLLK